VSDADSHVNSAGDQIDWMTREIYRYLDTGIAVHKCRQRLGEHEVAESNGGVDFQRAFGSRIKSAYRVNRLIHVRQYFRALRLQIPTGMSESYAMRGALN
jgi:hypothetical protein